MSIQKRLLGLLKSDEVRALATVGIDGISVKYPMIAVFMSAFHEAAGLADEMRIDALVKGLSTELNQEQQINILYGYVEESEENAFLCSQYIEKGSSYKFTSCL